jgi:hypothetical protein
VAKLGNTFGWSHTDWRPDVKTDEKMTVPIVSRGNEDTIRWLYAQVAPAIRRLLEAESLDLADFLEFIYKDLELG